MAIPLSLQFMMTDAAAATVANTAVRFQPLSESSNGAGFGSTEQLGFSGSTPGYIVEHGSRPGLIRPLSTPVGNISRPLAPEQRGLSGSTPGYIMNQRAMQTDGYRTLGTVGGNASGRDDFDWGWLGLLGLLGLAGSRRRSAPE